jgi:hypothetical protein
VFVICPETSDGLTYPNLNEFKGEDMILSKSFLLVNLDNLIRIVRSWTGIFALQHVFPHSRAALRLMLHTGASKEKLALLVPKKPLVRDSTVCVYR